MTQAKKKPFQSTSPGQTTFHVDLDGLQHIGTVLPSILLRAAGNDPVRLARANDAIQVMGGGNACPP